MEPVKVSAAAHPGAGEPTSEEYDPDNEDIDDHRGQRSAIGGDAVGGQQDRGDQGERGERSDGHVV